jgi:Kelch motif
MILSYFGVAPVPARLSAETASSFPGISGASPPRTSVPVGGAVSTDTGCPGSLPCSVPSPASDSPTISEWYNVSSLVGLLPKPGLTDASMAWDPTGDYLLLFGGLAGPALASHPVNYTWIGWTAEPSAPFGGLTWINITDEVGLSPPSRYAASMAYDANDGYMVLFGGQGAFPGSNTSTLSDTWKYTVPDGAGHAGKWTELTETVSPPPLEGAQVTYDGASHSVLLFGGSPGGANPVILSRETWEFSGGAWKILGFVLPPPPARAFGTLVYNSVANASLLTGGLELPLDIALPDYRFVGEVWHTLPTTDFLPGRVSPASSYDPGASSYTVFGGLNATGCTHGTPTGPINFDDTWTFNVSTATWSQLPAFGPDGRSGAAMAFDPAIGDTVLFGGGENPTACSPYFPAPAQVFDNDTWIFGSWPADSAPFSLTVTASATSIPVGGNVTFTATANGGYIPPTFEWDFGETNTTVPCVVPNSCERAYPDAQVDSLNHVYVQSGNYQVTVSAGIEGLGIPSQSATATVNISVGSLVVPNWVPSRDTYNFDNYVSPWAGGGDCYGISSSEVLYWEHDILGLSATAPYLPQAAANTSDLPPPVLNATGVANQLNETTLAVLEHQTSPDNFVTVSDFEPSNLPTYIGDVENQIRAGTPAILGLQSLPPFGYHAVIAYGEQTFPNGSVVLDISDPNVPLVTSYAWYTAPHGASLAGFSYTAGGDFWAEFVPDGAPEELQPSWYSDWDSAGTVTAYDFSPDSSNYYLIADGGLDTVSAPYLPGDPTDSFAAAGNSQTFIQGISGSSGIEEGSMQVFALPLGAAAVSPVVSDPSTGSSVVQVLWGEKTAGTLTIRGFTVVVSSATTHAFSLSPSSSGLSLDLGAASGSANVSFDQLVGNQSIRLDAHDLAFAPGSVANFTVTNWSALNVPGLPDVQVAVTPANHSGPATGYTLTNNQTGLGPGHSLAPAMSTPWYLMPPFLLLVGTAVGGAAVLGGVIVILQRREGKV